MVDLQDLRNEIDSIDRQMTELFEKRMQFQEIENCSVEYSANDGKYFSLVKGTARLTGIYFGYPHIQKRDFALLMRLERFRAAVQGRRDEAL